MLSGPGMSWQMQLLIAFLDSFTLPFYDLPLFCEARVKETPAPNQLEWLYKKVFVRIGCLCISNEGDFMTLIICSINPPYNFEYYSGSAFSYFRSHNFCFYLQNIPNWLANTINGVYIITCIIIIANNNGTSKKRAQFEVHLHHNIKGVKCILFGHECHIRKRFKNTEAVNDIYYR